MKEALACNGENIIVLSADKAVYPINATGMSRVLMEKHMIAKAHAHGDSFVMGDVDSLPSLLR